METAYFNSWLNHAMLRKRTIVPLVVSLLLVISSSGAASAQDMVFQFNNPSFQSQAIGSQWMLQTAQAQKDFNTGGNFGGFERQSPMERFQENLQRQVLSEISNKVVRDRFGEEVNLSEKSTFDFGNFRVDVTPGQSGSISIEVFNALTGASSTITIPEPR